MSFLKIFQRKRCKDGVVQLVVVDMKILWTLFLLLLPGFAAEPLRIVSYNIRHGAGLDGKVDLESIAKVIAKEKPDVVTLQEVDQKCTRSGSVDQAAELGRLLKMEHRFGKFMDFQGGEYGMAVLSRFPIETTTVHPLPLGAEPRCALEVVVKSPVWPGTFSLVGIHNDWTDEKIRVKQVTALVKALDEKDHPVILAGDFNTKPESASLQLLEKASWKMLRDGRKKTFPSVKPRVEIDFFFAKGLKNFSFEDKVLEDLKTSDHCLIALALSPIKASE